MRYVAKELRDTADISSGQGNQLVEFFRLISIALVVIISLYLITNLATEYFVSNISIENEKRWFGKIPFPEIDTLESTEEHKRVKQILHRLVQNPQVPKLDFQIFIIDESEINAFAFPGGRIGITRGLLEEIDDELALAFVIGHELGHFKFRHHLKSLSRSLSLSLSISIIFGNSSDLNLTENMLLLLETRHSRKQESESDFFAAELVYSSYGKTDNIDQLFQILKQKNKDKIALPFLSTHPSDETRIKQLNQYISKLKEMNP